MADSAPVPKTILRGHKAQVHAAAFVRDNQRLVTGDAEGYVVVWDLVIMRPRAVWRAHENAILAFYSHGRDHKLIVWRLGARDEERMSTALPLEDVPERLRPWIAHVLDVNTMNFCPFAACPRTDGADIDAASEIALAVPNTLASEAVDVYVLPSQERISTVRPPGGNGMVMGLALFHHGGALTLVGGFENGFASVHRWGEGGWVMTYRSQAHSQPVLSVDVGPGCEWFVTSAADGIIAKHPVPTGLRETRDDADLDRRVVEVEETLGGESSANVGPMEDSKGVAEWQHPVKVVNTRHAGQQSVRVRSDGRILVTAGWDARVRVYSAKTLGELAVLRWHKVGVYAVALAKVPGETETSMAGDAVARVQSVRERRIQCATATHWVAAGAKDGSVSLWDVY